MKRAGRSGRTQAYGQTQALGRTQAFVKKQRYYRTAALLGPKEQFVAYRAESHPIRIPLKAVLVLAAIVGLGLWVALGNAWYLLWDDLSVTGIYSPDMKQQVKLVSDLLGWHRFMLHPAEAEAAIATAMPQLVDVKVTCGLFPTKCQIALAERIPALVWEEGSTKYWVDREGNFFPAQGERPDLPVLRGIRPIEGGAHSIDSIQQGVAALSVLGVPADQLEYAPDHGLIWTDPAGRRVAFGVGPDMAPRWQMYQVLLDDFAANGISPQVVDVRFSGGATYSLERSW